MRIAYIARILTNSKAVKKICSTDRNEINVENEKGYIHGRLVMATLLKVKSKIRAV
jgi:hypothetical protein